MSMASGIARFWRGTRGLRGNLFALYLASRHPRVPWYAKVWCACILAYALSPIDLIPDPIPVLGQLDDLIIIPLGLALAIRMIPADVMTECREAAHVAVGRAKSQLIAAAVIVVIWLALAVVAGAAILERIVAAS